ncbi:MAG: hypothetical protein PUF48_07555 [Oscillospiraceae bacterium]|nr:hypothetical protein [Oscillospiraceae bacterium]
MEGIAKLDVIILFSLMGIIALFLIIGWIICLKILSDKKKFERPYIPFAHVTLTYTSVLFSTIIYLLNLGYLRFFALLVVLPYLFIFAVVCGSFGKFADYYPKRLITVNRLVHISFILPNLFCPDYIDNNQWVLCRLIPLKSESAFLVFVYITFALIILHIALLVFQIVLITIEHKNVKKILAVKKAEYDALNKRDEPGKFNF